MDDVDAMVRAIEQEPDDLTAVGALTDMLQELRDMTYTEALNRAEEVVQTARDKRDLGEATRIVNSMQPWHKELTNDIRRMCEIGDNEPFSLLLVPGDGQPVAFFDQVVNAVEFWMQCTVTVGALWVIRHFRKNPSLFLMEAKRKATRKLRKRYPR